MGYSTKLFAVDLATLTNAMGSNDSDLLARIQAAKEPEPPQSPQVLITLDSEIIFNGKLLTIEEFKVAIQKPEWAGTVLSVFQRAAKTESERKQRKKGQFGPIGSFTAFLDPLIFGSGIQGVSWPADEESFLTDAQDEISVDQALEELITGQHTDLESPHQYGYALERLCEMIGTRLETFDGKGRLKRLKLDTRLTESRPPVALLENDDFPYISHLTAEEVQQEVNRLRLVDLGFPSNADLEQDRRRFFDVLESAMQQQKSLVSFYY